jgi:hypothetical protein
MAKLFDVAMATIIGCAMLLVLFSLDDSSSATTGKNEFVEQRMVKHDHSSKSQSMQSMSHLKKMLHKLKGHMSAHTEKERAAHARGMADAIMGRLSKGFTNKTSAPKAKSKGGSGSNDPLLKAAALKGALTGHHTSDEEDNKKLPLNSDGKDRIVGDKPWHSHVQANGKVKPPGYTHQDAYSGPKGHYYIGQNRRRVGAGFGRRRRSQPSDGCRLVPVTGVVKDELTHEKVAGAKVVFTDVRPEKGFKKNKKGKKLFTTGKKVKVAYTNSDGVYKTKLSGGGDKCGQYHMHVGAKGYITEPTAGPHSCKDTLGPITQNSVVWNAGLAKPLAKGKTVVSLVWQNDMNHVKDLDLHIFVRDQPSLRPNFTEEDIAMHPHKKITTPICTATQNPPCTKINYLHTGYAHHLPFVKFAKEDHGSLVGNERGGGPETIAITKERKKQYDIGVDCWSCDEREERNPATGFIEDKDKKLTYKALEAFKYSQATVKVYREYAQVFCKRIASAAGHPHTWWDVGTISCDGKECTVIDKSAYNKATPTTPKTENGVLRSIGVKHPAKKIAPMVTKADATAAVVPPVVKGLSIKQEQAALAKYLHKVAVHAAASTAPLGCYYTGGMKMKEKNGWKRGGIAKDLTTARNKCQNSLFVVLECPRSSGFDVWCAPSTTANKHIRSKECMGHPEDYRINKASNGHCVGPYRWTTKANPKEVAYGGGYERGVVYPAAVKNNQSIQKVLRLLKAGHLSKALDVMVKVYGARLPPDMSKLLRAFAAHSKHQLKIAAMHKDMLKRTNSKLNKTVHNVTHKHEDALELPRSQHDQPQQVPKEFVEVFKQLVVASGVKIK